MSRNLGVALLSILLFVPCGFAEGSSLDSEINAYNQRNYSEAVKNGVDVIKQDPDNTIAHYYLANSYCELKQYNDAADEYSVCIKLAPESPYASYSRQALDILNRSGKTKSKAEATESKNKKAPNKQKPSSKTNHSQTNLPEPPIVKPQRAK